MTDVIAYVTSVWAELLSTGPMNQVGFVVGVIAPFAGMVWFVVTRSLKRELRRAEALAKELERQVERSEQRREKAEARAKEAECSKEQYDPSDWLIEADQEDLRGDGAAANRVLRNGFENVKGAFSEVCLRLCDHHLSLATDGNAEMHLGEARRLARLSRELTPDLKAPKAILTEVVDRLASDEQEARAYDPNDPKWSENEGFLSPLEGGTRVLATLLVEAGLKHFSISRFTVAERFFCRARNLCERSGEISPMDPISFDSRYWQAFALIRTWNGQAALSLANLLVDEQTRLHGQTHEFVLLSRYLRAVALSETEETYENCRQELESLLALREKISGPFHRETVVVRGLYTQVLKELGLKEEYERQKQLEDNAARARIAKMGLVEHVADLTLASVRDPAEREKIKANLKKHHEL